MELRTSHQAMVSLWRGQLALTVPLPCPPGLNVHSMLKHQTLVLTLPTVAFLEEKLLWHNSRYTPLYPFRLPYCDFP